MLTKDEIEKYIKEIENDIAYFNKIEFKTTSEKFERDLKVIKTLSDQINKRKN